MDCLDKGSDALYFVLLQTSEGTKTAAYGQPIGNPKDTFSIRSWGFLRSEIVILALIIKAFMMIA